LTDIDRSVCLESPANGGVYRVGWGIQHAAQPREGRKSRVEGRAFPGPIVAEWDFFSLSAGNHALPQTARKRQASCPGIVTTQRVRDARVNLWGLAPMAVVGSTSDWNAIREDLNTKNAKEFGRASSNRRKTVMQSPLIRAIKT
jgi:hypothetical protein